MVEFEYKPWEKVIIHEIVKYPLEQFLDIISLGVQEGGLSAPLLWSDGIIFKHNPIDPIDEVINELLQGKIHWGLVSYGIMEKYKEEIMRPGQITVPIVDVSLNPLYHGMAEWIKENFES